MIHFFAATNNLEKLREVAQPHLLITDFAGNSPLHYATESRSYLVAQYIVSLFPDVPFFNQAHLTPAHIAAKIGDLDLLKLFSVSKGLIESVTFTGWNPLHFAIHGRHTHCIEFLVGRHPPLLNDVTNEYDFSRCPPLKFLSPLDLARFLRDDSIVAFLDGHSALSSFKAAAFTNNLPAVSFFALSPESPFFGDLSTEEARTALEIAASMGHYQICHFLLERGCAPVSWGDLLRIGVLSASVPTVTVIAFRCAPEDVADACFFAADGNMSEIVFALLDCPIALDATSRDGDTLFLRFLKRRLVRAAEKLLAKPEADLARKDARGANALHYAAAIGALPIVKALVHRDSRVSLNEQDNDGRIPLHYAIYADHNDTIRYLLLARSDVNVADRFGVTPLVAGFVLVEKFTIPGEMSGKKLYTMDFDGLMENLKPKTQVIEYFDYRSKSTKSFAVDSVLVLAGEVLDFLKRNKMKTSGLKGMRLLHVVIVMTPFPDRLEDCLGKNAALLDEPDEFGRTPLHIAALLNRPQHLKLLIRKNANLSLLDHDGNSIFHYIRDDGLVNFVQSFVETYPALPATPNNFGQLPIHVVCAQGARRTVMMHCQWLPHSLLSAPDSFGKAPVDYALQSGSNECVAYLFSLGVKNALVAAIRHRDIQEAKRLLATGFPLNSTSKNGRTPLHEAAVIGDAEFVEFLLANKADVNAITSDGLRPIHCAAAVDSIPSCLAILRAGFDLDPMPDKDQPYQRCGGAECRKFLFDYWKRDHCLQMLVSFFESRKVLLFDCLNTAVGAKDTTNTPIPTFDSLAEFMQQLIFVTDMILPRVRRNKTTGIRPEFSSHHLLQLMDSMHIEAYAFALEDGFEVLCKIWATQDKQLIFIFLMPIYFFSDYNHPVYVFESSIEAHQVARPGLS
jgi:ankyrin repeat protein